MNLRKYWEERISKYGLRGAGNISLHPKVNEILKKLKIKDIISMVDFSEKRVLDAGCGTGLYSKLAKEKGFGFKSALPMPANVLPTGLPVAPFITAPTSNICKGKTE